MSDTDPDLRRSEGNLPVAIDVVDGMLVIKRHSGRKESFPLGGSGGSPVLFHRQTELETSYVIPDGSDYFVLSEDYNNEVILPTAEVGRVIRVTCTHIPRFGEGTTYVKRPDLENMNPDNEATQWHVNPGACITLISDGTDWWTVSVYGTVV